MKHIAFCSFGKDSLAQIIKIKEMGLPLDEVVCCRIWFDGNTPGEHPVQAEFITKATTVLKERYGIDVVFIRSDKTFKEYFYTLKQRGRHIGDCYGFPYIIGAWCVSRLKQEVIKKYLAKFKGEKVIQYVGIAFDEQVRIRDRQDTRYILNELKLTEADCFGICEQHDLLSPKYERGFRDGCWFCPKQNMASLYDLWMDYSQLFNELEQMQPYSHNTFKPNQSITRIKNRFENGHIPQRKVWVKQNNAKGAKQK